MSTPGLLLRHASTGVSGSLLVGLLVALAVFATAVAPRALVALGTEELRHRLAEASPALRDITGLGRIGLVPAGRDATAEEVLRPTDDAIRGSAQRLPEPLAGLAGEPRWVARSPQQDAALPDDAPSARLRLTLALDPGWERDVHIREGSAPAAWSGSDETGAVEEPLEVALSTSAAEALGVSVGELLGYPPLTLRIAALYEAADPDAPLWVHAPDLAAPAVSAAEGLVPTVTTSVYVAPGSAGRLANSFDAGALSAWIPIDPSGIRFGDAQQIATQVRERAATPFTLPGFGELRFSSRLADAVDQTRDRVAAGSALLALSLSGLLGVLVAVLALGIGAIVERRRTAIVLTAARGASALQLRGALFVEGASVALPAAVAGIAAAALLVPEPVDVSAWMLPMLVALAAPVVFAARAGAHGPRSVRRELRSRGGRVRLLAEALLVGAAALALLLLFRRGLVAPADTVGIDPLLALTPVLLAAAVCALALRVYPIPLRLVLDRVRRGDGAVGLVGVARAVRAPVYDPTASFALVLGVTVVVFSSVLGTTLSLGVTRAAAAEAGADIQVRAVEIAPDTVAAVARLEGVSAAAALTRSAGLQLADGLGTSGFTLVLADTTALHAVRPELPELDAEVDGRIPVVVSRDLRGTAGGSAEIGPAAVTLVDTAAPDALPGVTRDWVLADARFAEELGRGTAVAQRLLVAVDDPDEADAVAAAVVRTVTEPLSEKAAQTVTVTTARGVLDDVRSSPVIAGIEAALPFAAVSALALTVLALVLATLAAGAARGHLVGVLRVIGADRRQLRRILAWESAPVVVASIVVGVGLGLALPFVVTSAVDLRAFVGGDVVPTPVVDPLAVGLAVLAVLAAAGLAGAVALALGRRLAPAATFKMGER
ncbi:FtsX-like permease family protein [Protaetiibacter sp. SSC-01]|uniref:FtsX-like permease family protein n=1 Tax=Protaetiibacter sp. SSC-01 TaxID=2759943 RepID=UPI001657121B|nr:FtsX-like permease family protein [Protaetiibacter sp. SSC-01]QNO36753.1 FtsX-like permease family protein [Protaetiibacter sp. SSC-01]